MAKWTVEFDERALSEIQEWPVDIRANLSRIIRLIEDFGPHMVGMPHVRPIEGKVWEMRPKGKDGIARALCFSTTGRRAIILRGFRKKTEKTPRREIETANERMKDHG
jgi:phage-related protein